MSSMENYFHKDNFTRQKEFILDAIKIAGKYPLDKQKFEDWYYQKINFSESEQKEIWSEFNRASVQVETLVEYKFLLEQVSQDRNWIIETLAHENAHANTGEKLGAIPEGYTVTFIKKSDGKIEHLPAAIVNTKNLDPEKEKHVIVEIAKAPESYEGGNNYLSDGDLHRINDSGAS